MTSTKLCLIFAFISVLLPGKSAAQLSLKGVAILPAEKQYIEFQKPINTGKGWLALKAKKGSWELVPAHLYSKSIRSKRNGDRTLGSLEDMELTSDQPDALFLLRHPALSVGKVETPVVGMDAEGFTDDMRRPREKNGRVNISWRGGTYRLVERGLDVLLLFDKTKTRLGRIKVLNNDEYYSSLHWAGDLDRDGKLDVIVEYHAYESGKTCLYLSSVASQGNLVKEVSCWYGGG